MSHITFLYASQTGNAESISYRLYEDAVTRGYTASWQTLDELAKDKKGLDDLRTVVFVVSTTGDGDPPDNAAKFWRALRRSTRNGDPQSLGTLRFTILGLGDTNYSNFCNTAQRLDKQLLAAGAQAFYPKGLADDATGLEETVEPWIEGLWPALQTELGAKGTMTAVIETISDLAISSDTLAETRSSTQLPTEDKPEYKHQPLVLDFRALESLEKITGAPRVPKANCHVKGLDESAGSSFSNSNLTYPPWHKDMSAEDLHLAPFLAKVAGCSQLTTPDAVKRTLLVDLEIESSDAALKVCGKWQAGDSFNIYAPNSEKMVRLLLNHLGLVNTTMHCKVLLQGQDPKIELPAHLKRFATLPASLFDMFQWTADLTGIPKKVLLRALADHCKETTDRDRLLYLSSRQGTEAFNALRNQLPTVVDLLFAFPSCKPPPERLLELLPPLSPRSYSICNAPSVDSNRWRIVFNVVDYELEVVDPFAANEATLTINRRGVCTPWLESIANFSEPQNVLVSLRPNLNSFRLPPLVADSPASSRPAIMIGPGTGVAPFIGFLEQRRAEMASTSVTAAPIWLFYGCRHRSRDFLFRDKLETWAKDGTLTRLSLCFSRDEPESPESKGWRYVQDAMTAQSDEIADMLLNQNALLYLCGDAKGMAKDVDACLADIICSYTKKHPEHASKLLEEIQCTDQSELSKTQVLQVLMRWVSSRRYLRDLWA